MTCPSRFSMCALFFSGLTLCRALGLPSTLMGFISMDCASSGPRLLAQMSDFGWGFFVFGLGSKLGSLLLLFLLFVVGFMVLHRGGRKRHFREHGKGECRPLNDGLCSKAICDGGFDGKWKDFCCEFCGFSRQLRISSKANEDRSSDQETDGILGFCLNEGVERTNEEKEVELCNEDEVDDIFALKKMIKFQRRRANSAHRELEKERTAAATATDEALGMILRLQNEKSSLELKYNQFCRLAEEKQVHDQEVIQSLRWILMKHDAERSLLLEQLQSCRERLKICSQDNEADLFSCIVDNPSTPLCSPSLSVGSRLEDALISSLDWDLSPTIEPSTSL